MTFTFGFLKKSLSPGGLVFEVGDVYFGHEGDFDARCGGCCRVDKAPDGEVGMLLASLRTRSQVFGELENRLREDIEAGDEGSLAAGDRDVVILEAADSAQLLSQVLYV